MAERVILAPPEEKLDEVRTLSDAQTVLTQPDQVQAIERTVLMWLKQIGSGSLFCNWGLGFVLGWGGDCVCVCVLVFRCF